MMTPKHRLRIITHDKNIEIDKVEEFVSGHRYFYCRLRSGETLVFKRSDIIEVLHRKKDSWSPVFLKKVPSPTQIHVTTFENGQRNDSLKAG